MTFQKLPGNQGQIFIPKLSQGENKHLCPDCFACQWCSDQRCLTCRGKGCRQRKTIPTKEAAALRLDKDRELTAVRTGD